MPQLNFSPEALAALEHFRVHDVTRAAAHERALDAIEDGTGRSRAIWVASKGVYLKKVSVSSTMGVGIRVDHATLAGNSAGAAQ